MSMTKAQAKKRFREYEDKVYNPAMDWIRKHYQDDWSRVVVGDLRRALLVHYLRLSEQAREPQECPSDANPAPL